MAAVTTSSYQPLTQNETVAPSRSRSNNSSFKRRPSRVGIASDNNNSQHQGSGIVSGRKISSTSKESSSGVSSGPEEEEIIESFEKGNGAKFSAKLNFKDEVMPENSTSATDGQTPGEEEEDRLLSRVKPDENGVSPPDGPPPSYSTAASDDEDDKRNPDEDKDRQLAVAHFTPPDGGFHAWMVMVAAFLCNGIIFGFLNTFGVLYVHLKDQFDDKDPMAATKVSLVGSTAVGMTFLLSPVSGILADKYGIRRVAFFGSVLAFIGVTLSSFFYHKIEVLYLTYGVFFGCGASLCYTPSLVILGHYFRRYMGVVNGIVAAGSSIFTMAMPFVLKGLLTSYGLQNTFRFMAALTFLLIFCTLMFKPLMPKQTRGEGSAERRSFMSQLINVDNWRNRKYVIWALAIPSALFGYFVPYVHIVEYVKDILPKYDGGTLVTCIGITSGLGRIIFGKIADYPRVNRILLQQISFVAIGVCTMLLTAAPYFKGFQFEALVVFALIMGLFDGCFITMLGPIAFDICGPAGASQAIGFLLGMCSVPLTAGPPIAGLLYDSLGNYTVAFLAAGCPPIIGAVLMCCIYRTGGSGSTADGGCGGVGTDSTGGDDCEAAAAIKTTTTTATPEVVVHPADEDDDTSSKILDSSAKPVVVTA